MSEESKSRALSAGSAYQLANAEIAAPQFLSITPRWLSKFLEWKPLDAGIYRLNRVRKGETLLDVLYSQANDRDIPEGFIDYDPNPREYILTSVSTIIRIETRVSDIYSNPYDQIKEQLRLGMESVKEKQEYQIINSDDYGLLKNIDDSQRISSRTGSPTPDDLDELIAKVWKEPSFFLAHPAAIAAFGRECTRRGVPPVAVNLYGSPFITWRGIPIVPTDKLLVDGSKIPESDHGKTNILLIRTGEQKQGVIGLYQAGLPGEESMGLSVRFMGIDNRGVGLYLLSLYCSVAIMTEDAAAVLEDVEIGHYYEY
ncbi:MAG: Major membrane protein I [Firmicutes bacterium ADurb.Bin182]|nr:MAG: Major membrane protein I [Firmicutes bacterium ADurb.Bin182]